MILHGDCLEKLKELADNSVDSLVTDPPYGISFMGKKWDYDVPSVDIWREAIRVLKPGGHLLSFGGTRTYHRMVVNIEDAGFEIRDQIQWIYGSGFPKNMDISKAIYKAAGAEREVVGVNPSSRPKSKKAGMRGFDNREGASDESAGLQEITAPSTDLAKQWQGWGTALKPANEPIVLARKPLSESTVAKNVEKWGTGGINVDGCRVEYQSESDRASATPQGIVTSKKPEDGYAKAAGVDSVRHEITRPELKGRWPANVMFDEVAAFMLDEQSGTSKSPAQSIKRKNTWGTKGIYGSADNVPTAEYGDSGGASRFFYCAKASKSERNAGLEGMPVKECDSKQQNSRARYENGVSTNERPTEPKNQNHHLTVKPIKLMEYLIKLITPSNGTVLDPFMGSGSTCVAAKRLGFNFIGIEMNREYIEIAQKRIDNVASDKDSV